MDPVIETVGAIFKRWPFEAAMWSYLTAIPIAIPAIYSLLRKPRLARRPGFTMFTAALILGFPTALALLFVIPWWVFQVFVVPVIFQTHPIAMEVLKYPLAVSNWLTWNWPLTLPFVWLLWAISGTVLMGRRWPHHASAPGAGNAA